MAKEEVSFKTKLKEISKDVSVVSEEATKKVIVKNEEDRLSSTTFLSGVKTRIKRIEELRKFFVQPLNDQVKKINSMFKEQSEPLELIETKIKRAISDYVLEEDRKARVEQERLNKIREEADRKREEAGKEKIITPVKSVETVQQTVVSEEGRSTAKKVWKYKVVDINSVPREYLRCEINHSAVMEVIKGGVREISGLELYEDVDINVTTFNK